VRTLGLISFVVALPLLAACVTINVYFPSAQAQEAADRIIDDVWGPRSNDGNGEGTGPDDPSSQSGSLKPETGFAVRLAIGALDWFIPTARAAEPDIDVNTPAIKRITASMEQRHDKLKPYYESGAIGLTQEALVAVRDLNTVALPKRSQVKQLVAEENEDRNALYREIARANDHPEWESNIRDVFAERWVKKAPAGWYYRTDDGEWRQKR